MISKFNRYGVMLLLILFGAFMLFMNKFVTVKRCEKSLKDLFHERRSVEDFTDNSYLNLFLNEEKSFTNVPVTPCNATTVVTHDSARKSVMKICASHNLMKSYDQLTEKQSQILFRHLIVNDEYKFLYCYTPKVGCSNWKKVMKQLYGNMKEEEWVVLNHAEGFTYLSEYTIPEIEWRLRTYFKFMFIRNPVERALSLYRDKFNVGEEKFLTHYGRLIMSKYHNDSPEYEGKLPGDDVAFEDYIRYIATGVQAENMNEHYQPMNILCQPCVINYDFIGVHSHLVEDSEVVLKKIKAPDHIHYPTLQSWYNPTSDAFLHYYYSLLSPALLEDFIEKYRLDFQLFSFPVPRFVKNASHFSDRTFCFE